MYAQDIFECATEYVPLANPEDYSFAIDQATIDTYEPVVIDLFYWQINDTNGYSPSPLSEGLVLASIANLNMIYNTHNIFFKYRGYAEITSPPPANTNCYTDADPIHGFGVLETGGELNCFNSFIYDPTLLGDYGGIDGDYNNKNAINIYVPYAFNIGGFGATGQNRLIINPNNLLTPGLAHEIGHNLGLNHPDVNYNPSHPDPDHWINFSCEHVTREEFLQDGTINEDFNARLRADQIIDTAAAPHYAEEYCYRFESNELAECANQYYNAHAYIDEDTCLYMPGGRSCQDIEYQIFDVDSQNIMSNTRKTCMMQFTNGQIVRMYETMNSTDYPGLLATLSTDLSSLYELYKGEYYAAGPNVLQAPLFQPGFDYSFVECDGDFPQPSDYDDTNFTYNIFNSLSSFDATHSNFDEIIHPNHSAISIAQVNNSLVTNNIRKCYDNNNRNPLAGRVVRFNDGVFNNNVTIHEKDSLGINNENLVDELLPGLYTIDKQFHDGNVEQNVIIKDNE
jgi:hypothetical protein